MSRAKLMTEAEQQKVEAAIQDYLGGKRLVQPERIVSDKLSKPPSTVEVDINTYFGFVQVDEDNNTLTYDNDVEQKASEAEVVPVPTALDIFNQKFKRAKELLDKPVSASSTPEPAPKPVTKAAGADTVPQDVANFFKHGFSDGSVHEQANASQQSELVTAEQLAAISANTIGPRQFITPEEKEALKTGRGTRNVYGSSIPGANN